MTGGFVCCKLWLDLRRGPEHDAGRRFSKTFNRGIAHGQNHKPPNSCSQTVPNPRHDSTAPAVREASEFESGVAPRPRPDLPRRRNRTPIKAFGAVAIALKSQFKALEGARAQGEIARKSSKTTAGGLPQGLRPGARDPRPAQLRIVCGRRRNRGQESRGRCRQRDCWIADPNLTPCFSSGRVRRGACASKRRDGRDHLLQALVRTFGTIVHNSGLSAGPILSVVPACTFVDRNKSSGNRFHQEFAPARRLRRTQSNAQRASLPGSDDLSILHAHALLHVNLPSVFAGKQ